MILAEMRPQPPRERTRNIGSQATVEGSGNTWNTVTTGYGWIGTQNQDNSGWESMHDVPQGDGKWNDVQHISEELVFTPYAISRQKCTGCLNDPGEIYEWSFEDFYFSNCVPIMQTENIIQHGATQAALHRALSGWHNSLYNLNAKNLPDVSVILMEDVPKLTGSLEVILKIARKIASIGGKLVNLKSSARKWRRKGNVAKAVRADREIARLSKLYLGTEFALKQNVRTATELVAGCVEGWRDLTWEKQTTHVREHFIIETNRSDFGLCDCTAGNHGASTVETVRGSWCITTESQLNMRGTAIEQALAKIMAKAGVLPQLASVWEATPYSWLIDYIFRTGLLLNYVERANKIGFADLDIFRTAFSLNFERETKQLALPHCGGGGTAIRKYEFYERVIGADLNFPPVLEWFKLPHGDQWAKALAFFFAQFTLP